MVGRVLIDVRDWRLCRLGVTCVGRVGAVEGWMGGFGGAAAMGTTPDFPPTWNCRRKIRSRAHCRSTAEASHPALHSAHAPNASYTQATEAPVSHVYQYSSHHSSGNSSALDLQHGADARCGAVKRWH